MSEEYIIDCKNVKFTYSGAVSPAVNNVSLKIKRGEFVSVIGHNGSGNTHTPKHTKNTRKNCHEIKNDE